MFECFYFVKVIKEIFVNLGIIDRHVEAYEPFSGFENDGRNEKSSRVRRVIIR